MSNSTLVDYTRLSPNYSAGRVNITKIAVHYVAGPCTIYTVGDIFANPNREASSNYCVDLEGRVGLYVSEHNRSWCTSSRWADERAITIEVSNYADGSVSAAGWSKLVELMVDICRRNGISDFRYTGTRDGQLLAHRWFANTDCPGDWLYQRFPQLAETVNGILHDGEAPAERLVEDGWWGCNSTRRLQEVLGTPIDGEVWHQWSTTRQEACTSGWRYDETLIGSPLIKEMQRRLGVEPDGLMGKETISHLQRRMGTGVDGVLDGPSPCVREMQRRLNRGEF